MLIVPFMNAQVERLFSRMNKVKDDLRNRLSCNCLDVSLRIGEQSVTVDTFKPDPVIELEWLVT